MKTLLRFSLCNHTSAESKLGAQQQENVCSPSSLRSSCQNKALVCGCNFHRLLSHSSPPPTLSSTAHLAFNQIFINQVFVTFNETLFHTGLEENLPYRCILFYNNHIFCSYETLQMVLFHQKKQSYLWHVIQNEERQRR